MKKDLKGFLMWSIPLSQSILKSEGKNGILATFKWKSWNRNGQCLPWVISLCFTTFKNHYETSSLIRPQNGIATQPCVSSPNASVPPCLWNDTWNCLTSPISPVIITYKLVGHFVGFQPIYFCSLLALGAINLVHHKAWVTNLLNQQCLLCQSVFQALCPGFCSHRGFMLVERQTINRKHIHIQTHKIVVIK